VPNSKTKPKPEIMLTSEENVGPTIRRYFASIPEKFKIIRHIPFNNIQINFGGGGTGKEFWRAFYDTKKRLCR
jgi:hypothetical protein